MHRLFLSGRTLVYLIAFLGAAGVAAAGLAQAAQPLESPSSAVPLAQTGSESPTPQKSPGADPCAALPELLAAGSSSVFVGYGKGESRELADSAARVDLASQIRQKITATATVTENDQGPSLSGTSKSVVSEVLIGAKTVRRCAYGGSFSTVVSLEKSLFLKSLEGKLSSLVQKALALTKSLKTTKSEEVFFRTLDQANQFLSTYQDSFDDDLRLCRTYGGCVDMAIEEKALVGLSGAVLEQGDKDQYVVATDGNPVTERFKDELTAFLQQDGLHIAVDGITINVKPRRIFVKCRAKLGSKIPNSGDRVIEVRCTSTIAGRSTGRQAYLCRSVAGAEASIDDALTACQDRLQRSR